MSLIIFLIVGLIAGALASYIMGRQQDLLVNLLIGIIGAVGRRPSRRIARAWRLQPDRPDHHRHARRHPLHFCLAAHAVDRRGL
jgi:hypothetical protein